MKRKYYDTKEEAINKKKDNERIYYDANKEKYYTIKFKKESFWDRW